MKNSIRYTTLNNEILFDTNMIKECLGFSKSKLQKEMSKYRFPENEIIVYKNQFLFKEGTVIEFINFLVKERLEKKINLLTKHSC